MKNSEEGLTCLDVLENVEMNLLVVQDLSRIMVDNCFYDDINNLKETSARIMLKKAKTLTFAISEIMEKQLQIIKDRICKEYEEGSNENE
ncbi:MAG: hypothetical protein IJX99_01380 [Clostridia bacterium]|nr:hypothetical protein [Clostridia bacterium]